MDLSWIAVSDLKKAVNFFRDVLGLQVREQDDGYGWAELVGTEGGAALGLAQSTDFTPLQQGHNAIVTFTVDDIKATKAQLQKKGVHFIGELMEVPGEVILQLFSDPDGNKFQLVQLLRKL